MVEKSITPEENDLICQIQSTEEVKNAIFSIRVDSSPGRYKFGSGFFHSCWDIVQNDVVVAMGDLFEGLSFSRFYTASSLALILKVANPSSFDKFQPISLCSIVYKVC